MWKPLFNQEKALGVFPEILKLRIGSFPPLLFIHVCVQLLAVLTVLGGRTCASEAKAAKEMEIEKDWNMELFPDRSEHFAV